MAMLTLWLRVREESMPQIASILGLSLRTCYRLLEGHFGRPGRPAKAMTPEAKAMIEQCLQDHGGRVSIAYLKLLHPEVSRRAIGEVKKAWVRSFKAAKRAAQQKLKWQGPGRVWGLDGTQTPQEIAGKGGRVLVLRDLASRYTLAAEPAREKSSEVIPFLEKQFAKYAVPLVIKHDGGPGFTAKETQEYLRKKGVIPLLSPPYYPQYNGATERGMQDLKAYAQVSATLSGRGKKWLQSDLEKAVTMANQHQVKSQRTWSSAEIRFAKREPITDLERAVFEIDSKREVARRLAAFQKTITPEMTRYEQDRLLATAARLGVTQALVKGGYLTIEEGPISQPVSGASRAIICGG